MFLRAIATYDYEDDENPKLTERKSACERWANSKLTAFDKKYLQQFIDLKDLIILPLNTYFEYEPQVGDYYYFRRIHDGQSDRLLVMLSKTPVSLKEMAYLFNNINHIDVGRGSVKDTLDDVLKNPINYTGRDLHVASVRENVAQTKDVMLDNVEKILDRGDKLESLVAATDRLLLSSQEFSENATQLRENQQCCAGLRRTTRHAGETMTGWGEGVTGFFSRSSTPDSRQDSELLTPPPQHK